ncbi:MAG: type II toxin-antitoxin system VapB family antitoxin [Angustibacter sp.]
MALNIKDPDTDRLARELAALTGETITEAARTAIRERLARVRHRQRPTTSGAFVEELVRRGRARATVDDRPESEILGYGHDGLPV